MLFSFQFVIILNFQYYRDIFFIQKYKKKRQEFIFTKPRSGRKSSTQYYKYEKFGHRSNVDFTKNWRRHQGLHRYTTNQIGSFSDTSTFLLVAIKPSMKHGILAYYPDSCTNNANQVQSEAVYVPIRWIGQRFLKQSSNNHFLILASAYISI